MIPTVLFDLDGTLLDTNELILRSFLHALEGHSTQTREELIPHMGMPLVEQLKLFSKLDDVTEIMEKYRAFNFANHDALVVAFPYVKETLAALHGAGVKIGIVTSKIRKTTLMGLVLCGLSEYIDTIVSCDEVENPKPDPEGIRRALRELGAEDGPALMVGDSSFDLEAAKRAGIGAVGVSWSLKGREFLQSYNPDYIIDDIRELLPIIGVTEAKV